MAPKRKSTVVDESANKKPRTRSKAAAVEAEEVAVEVSRGRGRPRGRGRGRGVDISTTTAAGDGGSSSGRGQTAKATAKGGKVRGGKTRITTADRAAKEAQEAKEKKDEVERRLTRTEAILAEAKTTVAPPARSRPPTSKVMPDAIKPSALRRRKSPTPEEEEEEEEDISDYKPVASESGEEEKGESEPQAESPAGSDADMEVEVEKKKGKGKEKGKEKEKEREVDVGVKGKKGDQSFLDIRSAGSALSSASSNQASNQATPLISDLSDDFGGGDDDAQDELLAAIFSDKIEVDDEQPNDIVFTKDQLQGSSRVTGGVFGGHALGNTANIADMEMENLQDQIPVNGFVKIFTTLVDNPAQATQADLKCVCKIQVAFSLKRVLQQVETKWSAITQERRIYLFEDDFWIARGMYDDLLQNDEDVVWQKEGTKYMIYLCAELSDSGTSFVPAQAMAIAPITKAKKALTPLQLYIVQKFDLQASITAQADGDVRFAYRKYLEVHKTFKIIKTMAKNNT
ncbi:hypothetical protein BDN72DRAFT_895958 [Pluteus cervinus]|uniref:Uncharacterized protein n=1 Tax=Pluteus cervinus TaxID=181527 RepID=A0ACD3AZ56_9AGAR|nr:hypothetical protein BDN72DRAFT_895958 [Pluteus cervinus]